jgi:hypothetical protein
MGIEIPIETGQRNLQQRQNQRYISAGNAKVRKLETDLSFTARVLDISASGCLLQLPCSSPFTVDTLVDMCVNTSWVNFRALGSVRHLRSKRCRIGVSFVKLTHRAESELRELIAGLEAARQSRSSAVLEMVLARHLESHQDRRKAPDQ